MANVGLCPHLLTLPHPALLKDMASRAPLLLLPLACPLAAELAQLLVQPPLQLGPLGRVQGPVLGPTAWVEHSFPAYPLPGVGTSLFTTAVDLKGHESWGELWARKAAVCRSASERPPTAVQVDGPPFCFPTANLHRCPVGGLQDEQTSSTQSPLLWLSLSKGAFYFLVPQVLTSGHDEHLLQLVQKAG